MANQDLVKGLVIGVAAATLLPVVLRALGVRGDTLGHAALRAGALLGEKAREVAAEIGEIAEDVAAEMHAGQPAEGEAVGPADAAPANEASARSA